MTTRFTQVVSHWTPDEALTVIAFLDDLKETLWKVYGEEIIEQQQSDLFDRTDSSTQLDLDFNDRIPF